MHKHEDESTRSKLIPNETECTSAPDKEEEQAIQVTIHIHFPLKLLISFALIIMNC